MWTRLPCYAALNSNYYGYLSQYKVAFRMAFDIKYMPRTSIKRQVLADLVAEFTESPVEGLKPAKNMDKKLVGTISQHGISPWEVYVDGASNQKGSGVGLVLISPEKLIVEKSLRLDFSAMNNEAEYEALMMGMTMVQRMGGKSVKIFSYSRLVVGQVKGEFEAKDERMQGYLSQVKCLQSEFESFDLLHIPKSDNAHADSLTMLATSSAQNLPWVILVEDLYKPTETRRGIARIHQIRAGPS